MGKVNKGKKQPKDPKSKKKILGLEKKIEQEIKHFQEVRGRSCFPFLGVNITRSIVEDIFDELRKNYKECDGRLDVIIDSGGGDIDAAYNLSMLFRKYGTKELNFIIPRWAKSAATLFVCSGDIILMSPVAELGPLDPQITQINPLEGRLEKFSPLHIESTLNMIRSEFKEGNKDLAQGLLERLQFPLTLGGFVKYHEIAQQYLIKLLEARMKNSDKLTAEPKDIAKRLTHGYADHGFCINIEEAKNIGLYVVELEGEELDIAWNLYKFHDEKRRLQKKIREEEVMNMLKELPPELLDKLPLSARQKLKTKGSKLNQEVKL